MPSGLITLLPSGVGKSDTNGARMAGLFGKHQQEPMGLSRVCLSRIIPHVTADVPPEPPSRSRLQHGEDYESLGHASIQITLDTYSHVAPGLQEAAARRFEEAFTTTPKKELVENLG